MGATKAVGPAAAAYAAALRAAVDGYLSLGGTQKELAVASHVAPATLSRYLSGERIAPSEFVASLATFLAEHGQPLDEGVRARLAELCGRAHEASGSPAVQLVHLKEELAHVREKKGAREAELAALQRHADQLAAELRQALERARRSEKERLALEGRVADQEKSRQHAQTYTRRLQSELTALHEQVLLVQGEVEVLRRQNQRLVEEGTEIPGPRVEAPVSGVSTQVSGMRGESSLSSGSADRDGKRKEGHRKEPKKPKPGSRGASRLPEPADRTPRTRGCRCSTPHGPGTRTPEHSARTRTWASASCLSPSRALPSTPPCTAQRKTTRPWSTQWGAFSCCGGVIEVDDMRPHNAVRRLMRVRTLRLDSTGLTTRDSSGEQRFSWTAIRKISIHHTKEIGFRAPLAVHIQLEAASAEAALVHRPAGWPLALDPPEACQRPPRTETNEWVPVCVLGPLSGPDKTDLQNTIAAYLKYPLEGIW
ncbi:helix-turn-helix domain-containing protein [Streptomyces sp. PDY-4]|uniref:helix-turn-helix domain-containing protein n=1 Tax=Streptomyces sp. PDY-4 TaxID=3376070 RepID=UPI0037B82AB8